MDERAKRRIMISNKDSFNKKDQIQIYCDMDGVLTDFDQTAKNIDPDIYNLPAKEMWKLIQNTGIEFWENMPWTKDGKKLWNFIKSFNPYILTALPGLTKNDLTKINAEKGKINWVNKNLGEKYLSNLILTISKDKYKFAAPNKILIDDREDLIKEWIKHKGIGIHHINSQNTINQLKKYIK
jgi:hypothetical protein